MLRITLTQNRGTNSYSKGQRRPTFLFHVPETTLCEDHGFNIDITTKRRFIPWPLVPLLLQSLQICRRQQQNGVIVIHCEDWNLCCSFPPPPFFFFFPSSQESKYRKNSTRKVENYVSIKEFPESNKWLILLMQHEYNRWISAVYHNHDTYALGY